MRRVLQVVLLTGLSLFAMVGVASTPAATTTAPTVNYFLAGYRTGQTGSSSATTTFTVPKVTCSSGYSGLAPGALILAGPTNNEKLDGAALAMLCYGGVLHVAEDLIVGGVAKSDTAPVRAGDTIRASVTVAAGGTNVELKNLTSARAFDLTLKGADTHADRELLGVDVVTSSNSALPLPVFAPVHFTASKVGGAALNTFAYLNKLQIVNGCDVLAVPSGLDSTGTKFTVQMPAGLTITNVSPEEGLTGTLVTILGTGFTSGSTVSFNGVASTSVTHVSATKLKATVPPTATTGPVTVQNTTAPKGSVSSACRYFVDASITSFSPTSGITGSSVTIHGSGFEDVANVAFNGGRSAKFKIVSPAEIDATVPSGAITGPISVTNGAGSTTSSTNYTVTLSITGFSPSSGPAGTVVTINGVGFSSDAGVTFGGAAAPSIIHVSSHRLKATVPAGAVTGAIRVTNTSGTVGTVHSPGKFKVT